MSTIKKQIQLAKSHGIYGFAIIYSIMSELEEQLDIFLNNNEINFPFF